MSGRRRLMIANAGRAKGYPVTATVFDVAPDGEHLTFSVYLSGHATLDWGDGSAPYLSTNAINTTNNNAPIVTHTYPAPGTYTVIIDATDDVGYWVCTGSNIAYVGYRSITVVRQIGTMCKKVVNMLSACSILEVFLPGVHIPDGVTSMLGFLSAGSNTTGKITSLNDDFTIPETVTNMSFTFGNYGYSSLKSLTPSFQFPRSLSNGFYMFYYCNGMETFPANLKFPPTVTDLQRALAYMPNLAFDLSNLFPEEWADGGYTCDFTRFAWGSGKLTGTVPAFIYDGRNNFTHDVNSFGSCKLLTNYNDIPASWGGGGA